MKVIVKSSQFMNLVIPAIESYPQEYYGTLFGNKTARGPDEKFIVDFAFPSLTAKRDQKEVTINKKKDRLVAQAVSYLTNGGSRYIGDFHSHTLIRGQDYRKIPDSLDQVVGLLQKKSDFSDEDCSTMEKNRNHIYLLMVLVRNYRPYTYRITGKKELFGSVDGFNFLMLARYWDSSRKKLLNSDIDCFYALGVKKPSRVYRSK